MSEEAPQNPDEKPAEQAVSPISGTAPPVQSQYKPGESGNPAGRPTAGASLCEWVNVLHEMTEAQIRLVARDPDAPVYKRAAAERWLRTVEVCDIATFGPLLSGEKSLPQLREAGVNTEVVKKLKYGEHGPEIELHDRSGEDFDRIFDRTEGKPKQSVELRNDSSPRSDADRKAAADTIVADLLEALGRKSAADGAGEGATQAPAGQ